MLPQPIEQRHRSGEDRWVAAFGYVGRHTTEQELRRRTALALELDPECGGGNLALDPLRRFLDTDDIGHPQTGDRRARAFAESLSAAINMGARAKEFSLFWLLLRYAF